MVSTLSYNGDNGVSKPYDDNDHNCDNYDDDVNDDDDKYDNYDDNVNDDDDDKYDRYDDNLKSRWPSGPGLLGCGPSGLLDNVLHAVRALRRCDPRISAMMG